MVRVGSVVYATNQGLGILAKDFYDNGILTDVAVVHHGSRKTHAHWYPSNSPQITSIHQLGTPEFRNSWLNKMDVMFFFETPFDWSLISYCKDYGIKTIMMPMYECMPKVWPAYPDQVINPSALDQEYYPHGVHIPVPVSVKWRQRTRARTFIHRAGHGGLKGRNGTAELVEAMRLVKSEAKLYLSTQAKPSYSFDILPDNIYLSHEEIPYKQLWSDGDALIFPEKFNGLSLPLQEARAAGMLVMATDRFPMNAWLPREPLIPVKSYHRSSVSGRCVLFNEAIIDPQAIADKIDEYYNKDITGYSVSGMMWAETMSWKVLKPLYMEEIDRCVSST